MNIVKALIQVKNEILNFVTTNLNNKASSDHDHEDKLNTSGGSLSGDVTFASKKGVKLTDKTGAEYYGLYDNGTNLWVGAKQTDAAHHTGHTIISSGYNGVDGGNETIKVSVPNSDNTGATNYDVLHTGNYQNHVPTGIIREFDTGSMSVQTYTANSTLSKFYIVTCGRTTGELDAWSIVVDYRSIKSTGDEMYATYPISDLNASLTATIDKTADTVTFEIGDSAVITHICGYY